MPSKTKGAAAADKATQPQIPAELLDQLVTGPLTAGQVQGLFDQFKKAVLERALAGEMSHHLGYAPGKAKPQAAPANHRNGTSAKTVLTDTGALRIDVPRDRQGTSAEAAQAELDAFEAGAWGKKFPTVVGAWRRAWDRVIPFFAFPPEVRRVSYTTNAIESVNARLRKIIKPRGHFPSDDAATKLIWLALRNITQDWGRAATRASTRVLALLDVKKPQPRTVGVS